jgi:hypothetical protein
MNERYLWDHSGQPDEELARLERLLGQLRFRDTAGPPAFESTPGSITHRRLPLYWIGSIAAVLAIAFTLFFVKLQSSATRTAWQLYVSGEKPSAFHTGQVIETSAGTAFVKAAEVGEIELKPRSRFRLLDAREGHHRFALDRGSIHAFIWAPPGRFMVDTPSAKAVDLGCRYTLRIDKDGAGLLTVEMGWVAFEWHGLESFIPAGAACRTRSGRGPGTPYFLDAPKSLANGVFEFDQDGDDQALESVLASARKRDALTLWHLLMRTEPNRRGRVFDHFAGLVSLPSDVTRDRVLRGDRAALDAAWSTLGLGSTQWWRKWKSQW